MTEEFGSIVLNVEVTATGSSAGDGFAGGILFADIGGTPTDDPVFGRDLLALMPQHELHPTLLALA